MSSHLRRRKQSIYTDPGVRLDAASVDSEAEHQLPSPHSSLYGTDDPVDDIVGEPDEDLEPVHYKNPRTRRRKSLPPSIPKENASDRMDIPLAVALIPPLGSFLTGGDFLRDSLLLLLLFFYLHQLIKLPWDLYLASRPHGVSQIHPSLTPEQMRLYKLAETELKRSELAYLALSVLAPLLGASLLRYVGTALTGKDYISWFNTGIFVLVTGVRPWRHLSHRLHVRAEELQETMATFQHKGLDTLTRIAELEKEVKSLKNELATKQDITKFKSDVSGALDAFDSALGRHEHTLELYQSVNERIIALERRVADVVKDSGNQQHSWASSHSPLFERANTSPPAMRKSFSETTNEDTRLPEARLKERRRKKTRSNSYVVKQKQGVVTFFLDLLLYPFSIGRSLLFGIVEFLQKHLV